MHKIKRTRALFIDPAQDEFVKVVRQFVNKLEAGCKKGLFGSGDEPFVALFQKVISGNGEPYCQIDPENNYSISTIVSTSTWVNPNGARLIYLHVDRNYRRSRKGQRLLAVPGGHGRKTLHPIYRLSWRLYDVVRNHRGCQIQQLGPFPNDPFSYPKAAVDTDIHLDWWGIAADYAEEHEIRYHGHLRDTFQTLLTLSRLDRHSKKSSLKNVSLLTHSEDRSY